MEFRFYNLKNLCISMRKNHKSLEQFEFEYKNTGIVFDCIIDIDANPFEIMIGTKGLNFSCILYVKKGFVTEMRDTDFYKLRDILNLTKGENPFTSFAFLKYLDSKFPLESCPEPVAVEHIIPYRAQKLAPQERAEGFIFAGWLPHEGKNNGHVRNINKTRQLLGEQAAQYCERNDVSSKWSTKEAERKKLTFPWDA